MSELAEKSDEASQESATPTELLEINRELYGFSKEIYADGVERIRRTEDKSAKLITLCASLIAFAGFIGIFIVNSFIPPRVFYDWICLICFILFIIVAIYAFASLLGTLNITSRRTNPLNQEMIAFFDKHSHAWILHALAEQNVEAVKLNDAEHKKKIKKFKNGYRAIFCSLIIMVVFIVSQVIKAFVIRNCGG